MCIEHVFQVIKYKCRKWLAAFVVAAKTIRHQATPELQAISTVIQFSN
jgi:hypothetical protein